MKTILCPTDFSACAANAIKYAHELALLTQSRLILFHYLYDPAAVPAVNPTSPIDELIAQDRLASICQKLRDKHPQVAIAYETKVSFSDAAFEIAHIADTHTADLVVMGTSPAHGLKEKPFSFTPADVLEISKHPVLVVPQTTAFSPIKRIVFAADLVEKPSTELPFVVEFAQLFQAEILFLHVLKVATSASRSIARIEYNNIYAALGYDRKSFHMQENTDIEKGILEFANDTSADLLVMINRPQGFFEYLFNRSQTRKLAYHSPIPILAIHE